MAATIRRNFTFKVPVGRLFQEQFDANVAKIRNAVVPILSPVKGKPVTIGSAVLIDLDGSSFLVTALHVLEDSQGAPLLFFGADGNLASFGDGIFFTYREFDLAALPLIDIPKAAFARHRFLTINEIDPTQNSSKKYATIVGYPSTKTKILKGSYVDTEMYSMADFIREEKDHRLFVKFDKRRVTFANPRRWVTAPDPYGMSGGAIFAVPVLSIAPTFASEAKLVGIATHWRFRRRLFEGTAAERVLAFLKHGADIT